MTPEEFYGRVMADYPARCGKKQKEGFLRFAEGAFSGLGFAVSRFCAGGCRNLIVGDPSVASVVITAHYDTARRNLVDNRLYFDHPRRKAARYLLGETVSALTAVRRNPVNANDNTSGLTGVFACLSCLPAAAGVLFDNEERGGIGSYYYEKKLGWSKRTLHVNLDCIGVGDAFAVIYNPGEREAAVRLAASAGGSKRLSVVQDHPAAYYSDNRELTRALTLAAFETDEQGLRYNSKIHTVHDAAVDFENISFASRAVIQFCRNVWPLPRIY